MTPPLQDELFNYNTTNATNSIICWPKRPCYRLQKCFYCRSRKRKQILTQIQFHTFKWDLRNFVTVTLLNYSGPDSLAVETLQKVRRIFIRRFFKGRKYIAFLAVESNSYNTNRVVPHFHFLVDADVTRIELKKALCKLPGNHVWDLNISIINRTIRSVRRLAGYLMDQNYFKTLCFKGRRVRLITGSKGFVAGKPTNKVKTQAWVSVSCGAYI